MLKYIGAIILWLLSLPAMACTPIYGGTTISTPGCYFLAYDILDPIVIDAPNVTINMNGRIRGCRDRRGIGFRVLWGPGFHLKNGTIRGCDWGVDAYSGGHRGDGMHFENLKFYDNSFRAIQVDGDKTTVNNVQVTDHGPSRAPGYCLTIGVDLLGEDQTVNNLSVRTFTSVGSLPSCEAVGLSISSNGPAYVNNLLVDNTEVSPEEDRHFAVWLGGYSYGYFVNPHITGTYYGISGNSYTSYGGLESTEDFWTPTLP